MLLLKLQVPFLQIFTDIRRLGDLEDWQRFFIIIFAGVIIFLKIIAGLAEALLEQVLCAFSPLLLAFKPDPHCLSTGLATKIKISTIISREPLLLKLIFFIYFQAIAAPALASALFTAIRSPKTYLLIPLDAL